MATPTLTQITTPGRFVQHQSDTITINEAIDRRTMPGRPVRSAYLHVPFCFHKCHYCDFYSIVDNRDRQAAFTDRLIAEIEAAVDFLSPPLQTIFIGGGTPTLLATPLWEKLLCAVQSRLPLEETGEFTVEANPETVTDELARVLKCGGVNRISIGCQSFNPKHLKTLERWHDPANVHRSVSVLRNAGISNINLDLIFAIPGQSLDEWLADLDEALSLEPAHISCYGLVYEPNTPLTVKMKSGAIMPADQDLEAKMFAAAIDCLAAAGFEHYEISNWAKKGNRQKAVGSSDAAGDAKPIAHCLLPTASTRCLHNMAYWTNQNWWPFGPSASGHVNGARWKNIPRLGEYLDHGPFPRIADFEQVDEDSRVGEEFMLGLRLLEGLPLERVEELLSAGQRSTHRRAAIERHIEGGLLERSDSRLRLRAGGLMLADSVLADLI